MTCVERPSRPLDEGPAHARDLVEAGVDGFLHLVRDEEMDDALVRMMKEKRVFVTPNLRCLVPQTAQSGEIERRRCADRAR
jgi:hypothetical protein